MSNGRASCDRGDEVWEKCLGRGDLREVASHREAAARHYQMMEGGRPAADFAAWDGVMAPGAGKRVVYIK